MSDLLAIMWLPFLACLVLSTILGYLGMHVLSRGIIFVDLALAQFAALGASLGILLEVEPEDPRAYACRSVSPSWALSSSRSRACANVTSRRRR